jgi:hypothetical protein
MKYDADIISALFYIQQHDKELAARLMARFVPDTSEKIRFPLVTSHYNFSKVEWERLNKLLRNPPAVSNQSWEDHLIEMISVVTGLGLKELKETAAEITLRGLIISDMFTGS